MHEMAIAQGILDIVLKTAIENGAVQVKRVTVLIGEMTQVEPESLRFGFAALAEGTQSAGAELIIETIPLVGRCRTCGQEFPVQRYSFVCPCCDAGGVTIISGRELRVDHLEVD